MRTVRDRVNLCFHGVGRPGRELEPGEDAYWITLTQFEDVLDAVTGRPDVRLSFDDGNVSDVDVALPRLVERGLDATFFVLTGRLGLAGSLSESGVASLAQAGMRIGSHGHAHRSWRSMDRATSTQELHTAAGRLRDLSGQEVTEAACPLGEYDRGALRALRQAGFNRVSTSDRVRAVPDGWLQPRFSVRSEDDGATISALLARPRSAAAQSVRATLQTVKRWR